MLKYLILILNFVFSAFVGFLLYRFIRLVITPVPYKRFVTAKNTSTNSKIYKIKNNIYLWHDYKAKKFYNKIFLIKVRKENEE